MSLHRRALLGPAGRVRCRGSRSGAPEIAQSSISSQTACSSCSSQSAPGSAMAQLVQVPIGRAGAVLTLARTTMPGVSSHGRAQRGRRHPPVRRWIAGSHGERDAGRELGAEPERERVGRSVVADRQQRLGFVWRLRLLERDQVRVRRPQPARLGAPVTRREVPEGAGVEDLVDRLFDQVIEPEAVRVVPQETPPSPRDTGRTPARPTP